MAERQIHICSARVRRLNDSVTYECAVALTEPGIVASVYAIIWPDSGIEPTLGNHYGTIELTPHKGAITIPASDGE